MIAGIATYLKGVNPRIRIVGVQAENVAPLIEFKKTDELKFIDPATLTLADGVNIKVRTLLLLDTSALVMC
jgi:threonine dehydratase